MSFIYDYFMPKMAVAPEYIIYLAINLIAIIWEICAQLNGFCTVKSWRKNELALVNKVHVADRNTSLVICLWAPLGTMTEGLKMTFISYGKADTRP